MTGLLFQGMVEETLRLDRLETQGATIEVENKLGELRRDVLDELSAPKQNMRCKNCTVEWKA